MKTLLTVIGGILVIAGLVFMGPRLGGRKTGPARSEAASLAGTAP